MFIPFESLPDNARIWIYQATRRFNSSELPIISDALGALTEQWTVHGSPLHTSFDIRYGQFIILAADEDRAGVSGCSIDSSVRAVKELGNSLGIDFFDRTRVCFAKGDHTMTVAMAELPQQLADGAWDEHTPTFNNLVATKGDLGRWLVPAGSTWLKRYLPRKREPIVA